MTLGALWVFWFALRAYDARKREWLARGWHDCIRIGEPTK